MDNKTQKVVALVLRVLAMAMAAVSIALALVAAGENEVFGVVLGIGLFALATSAILEPQNAQDTASKPERRIG